MTRITTTTTTTMTTTMTAARLAGRIAVIGAALAVPIALGACSLPVDERVTPVDRDQFGDQLTQDTTTTSTTTSTTVATTTTVPDDTSVATEQPTTTVALVETETVTVYYTRGTTDVMHPVEHIRGANTPVDELIRLLERPSGISTFGYQSAVRPGLIERIAPIDRGVATVTLDPSVLDIMSEPVRQRAIAQIVLTVTSFRTANAGNIGRVRFEVDGEGLQVFVPALGGQSEPGEELAFTDFQSLIATTPDQAPATPPPSTDPAGPPPTADPPVVDDGGEPGGQ